MPTSRFGETRGGRVLQKSKIWRLLWMVPNLQNVWKIQMSSSEVWSFSSYLKCVLSFNHAYFSVSNWVCWRVLKVILNKIDILSTYSIKWRIFSRTGKIGSGKNTKYFFFYWAWSTPWGHVLSLKTFCQIPAMRWAISNSVFQPVKFTSTLQKLLATFFQIFDIWWSSLDIMDDLKLISRTVIFRLGEINNIMIFSYVKKNFLNFFLVRY